MISGTTNVASVAGENSTAPIGSPVANDFCEPASINTIRSGRASPNFGPENHRRADIPANNANASTPTVTSIDQCTCAHAPWAVAAETALNSIKQIAVRSTTKVTHLRWRTHSPAQRESNCPNTNGNSSCTSTDRTPPNPGVATCPMSSNTNTGVSTMPATLEAVRSEEHTSELQSRGHLVCRLLLEKKKQTDTTA